MKVTTVQFVIDRECEHLNPAAGEAKYPEFPCVVWVEWPNRSPMPEYCDGKRFNVVSDDSRRIRAAIGFGHEPEPIKYTVCEHMGRVIE